MSLKATTIVRENWHEAVGDIAYYHNNFYIEKIQMEIGKVGSTSVTRMNPTAVGSYSDNIFILYIIYDDKKSPNIPYVKPYPDGYIIPIEMENSIQETDNSTNIQEENEENFLEEESP